MSYTLLGQYTTATLPPASSVLPGTQAYTSDQGALTSDGVNTWSGSSAKLKKHPFMPAGVGNVQKLMASPPTVAISTTNPLSSGQRFSPYDNSNSASGATSVDLSFCSISRGGNPIAVGPTANQVVKFETVSATAGGASYAGGNAIQVGVMYTSNVATPVLVFQVYGRGADVTIKINDQYVSLTPTAVPVNGVNNYISLTFAAPITPQELRIDFICGNVFDNFFFGGFWTGLTDTLYPAQIRGPRILIVGDSYTTATGAASTATGYVGVFSEYMGWDDVWPSGIGGTGLIATGSGAYCTYLTRAATDIYPFNPDEVIIQGFFNDNSSQYAAVQAALQALIQAIRINLPACRVTVFGPCVNSGSGYQTGSQTAAGFPAERAAIAATIAYFNTPLVRSIDPTTGPAPVTPQTLTITSATTAGGTTFVTNSIGFACEGSTYQWPNGERSLVLSRSGYTATVDKVGSVWPIGTVITQVGSCYIRGNGYTGATTGVGNADYLVYTDDIHPAPAGHYALGMQLATAYAANLNT